MGGRGGSPNISCFSLGVEDDDEEETTATNEDEDKQLLTTIQEEWRRHRRGYVSRTRATRSTQHRHAMTMISQALRNLRHTFRRSLSCPRCPGVSLASRATKGQGMPAGHLLSGQCLLWHTYCRGGRAANGRSWKLARGGHLRPGRATIARAHEFTIARYYPPITRSITRPLFTNYPPRCTRIKRFEILKFLFN